MYPVTTYYNLAYAMPSDSAHDFHSFKTVENWKDNGFCYQSLRLYKQLLTNFWSVYVPQPA